MSALDIEGVGLEKLNLFHDERGRFVEMFRAGRYPEHFVQGNHSRSTAGVLRGLHYHRKQADLWYIVRGQLQVGLVDLRHRSEPPASRTLTLREEEPSALYIPSGVAHGFLALTDVDLIYWVTQEYDGTDEYGVAWDDPQLNLNWASDTPFLSDRDKQNPRLEWDKIPTFS